MYNYNISLVIDMIKIKCKLIKGIFKNEMNGYNISIVKILDSDDSELLEQKKIYAVGVFESLNNRLNYLMEGNLEKFTKFLGIAFFLLAIVLNINF